jgi:cell surface protein SprA
LGFNIPRGSVTVTAGGQVLQENIDYEINYDLGTLRVINQAIINAGLPVQVQYENNASFGLLQKNLYGPADGLPDEPEPDLGRNHRSPG